MADVLQFLISGLVIGSIYGLAGIGFTGIYNVTGVVNFAQGDKAMIGASSGSPSARSATTCGAASSSPSASGSCSGESLQISGLPPHIMNPLGIVRTFQTKMSNWIRLLGAVALIIGGSAQAQDTIKVGSLFETSGFLAFLGNQGLEGANLAVEEINAAGGVLGKEIELINFNTESDETKAVIGVKKLIERDKVVALIGAMNSGSTFSIIDIVQRAEIPIVSNGASRALSTPVDEKKWIFQAPLTDVLVINVLIDYMKKHGISKIGLINADSGFATSGQKQWEKIAPQRGIDIVIQQTYGNSDPDMTPQLTNIRASSDVQAVVQWGTGKGQAIVAKNYRQLGIGHPLFYSHAASDPNLIKLAGSAANGIVFPTSKIAVVDELPDSDPQKEVTANFVKKFVAKYGRGPATFAGNGYDSMMMLAAAIGRAGSTDSAAIRDAFEQTTKYPGVTSVYTYSATDHYGAQPEGVALHAIKDGRMRLLEE